MTFEETRQAIYSLFFDNINKTSESLKLCREVDNQLQDLKAKYDRLLEKNKMLKVKNKMLKVENEKLNDMLDEQERSWL